MLKFVLILMCMFGVNAYADDPESISLPKEEIKPTPFELPSWFKSSFLDLPTEIKDATKANKKVLIFAHQENCPFCAKFISTTFKDDSIKEFMLKHFEVIELDVNGEREMTASNHQTLKEKKFAREIKIFATPTLLFLNSEGIITKRYSGFYPPDTLLSILQAIANL